MHRIRSVFLCFIRCLCATHKYVCQRIFKQFCALLHCIMDFMEMVSVTGTQPHSIRYTRSSFSICNQFQNDVIATIFILTFSFVSCMLVWLQLYVHVLYQFSNLTVFGIHLGLLRCGIQTQTISLKNTFFLILRFGSCAESKHC